MEKKFEKADIRQGLMKQLWPLVSITLLTDKEPVVVTYFLARSETVEQIRMHTYESLHEKNLRLSERLNLWHRRVYNELHKTVQEQILDLVPTNSHAGNPDDGFGRDLWMFKYAPELWNTLSMTEINTREVAFEQED
jgi:hypothetical protein